jgi:hypothetical protein
MVNGVAVVVDVAVYYGGAWTCRSALPRFVDNGDGTVTDNWTGLMWEKKTGTPNGASTGSVDDVNNTYAWSASGSAADGTLFSVFLAGLNGGDYYSPAAGQLINIFTPPPQDSHPSGQPGTCLANHCDWRIPTIGELISILDFNATGCAFPPGVGACIDPTFGPTLPAETWASSTVTGSPQVAWNVTFYVGFLETYQKSDPFYARAVRTAR